MGMGDVKLAALIGLVLGSQGLALVGVAAGVGVLLGGVGSIVALLAGASRKQAIPFGPFLAAGALVAVFAGSEIASRYLDLMR
jgi:leader peptidase (prepilin peptidase)/N-methyltransferase